MTHRRFTRSDVVGWMCGFAIAFVFAAQLAEAGFSVLK